MKKTTMMTEGNIWKQIIFFSIPLILGNLFQQLYNTVDSIVVGNYIGSEALAAVGASSSIINLLIGFCVGASAGAGVVIAQSYGASDKERTKRAVHSTIAIAVLSGTVLLFVGILFTPQILTWMGTPAEVFDGAATYLKIYFGGIVFNVVYNMSAGILNAVGNSRRSLLYLMIAAVSNVFLDLFFVVVLRMGIAGVALATDISQLISCVFVLAFLVRSTDLYRVTLREIKLYKEEAVRIIQIGIPTGLQNIVISFSNVIVQSSVNTFGANAMAGFTSYMKIDGFNILPVLSFSMAATTFCGQNIGAGKYDRVRKGMWISLLLGIVYSILAGILLLLFAKSVIGIFTGNGEVISYGVEMFKYFCPFYFILAFMNILSGTIRGTGKTVEPMLIFLASLCVFRILWIFVTQKLFGQIEWIYMAYPASWIVGGVLMGAYGLKGKWFPQTQEEL